jgi:zinc finger protein
MMQPKIETEKASTKTENEKTKEDSEHTDAVLPGICSACGAPVTYHHHITNIPHFFDIILTSMNCPECGYREHDTQCLSTKPPSQYTLLVKSSEELTYRVVRSTAATIIIPELGVEINPGPACEGFISNVEGVLTRVDAVLDTVLLDDEASVDRVHELKVMISEIKAGKREMTLIIKDPHGTSMIEGSGVIIEDLVEEMFKNDCIP